MYRFRQDFRPFPLTADGWQWVYIPEQYWDSVITATQRYNCHSLVTRLRLLGLSFRQCSFCLCRYVHLAVQPQLGNFIGLRRCRHAFVPVVVSLAGQPVDGGIYTNTFLLLLEDLLCALYARTVFTRGLHTDVFAIPFEKPL